jgi:hypothetical protein
MAWYLSIVMADNVKYVACNVTWNVTITFNIFKKNVAINFSATTGTAYPCGEPEFIPGFDVYVL